MKSTQIRENARKLKVNPHQSKDVQSQSPPHKKLLKKIEMIHKDNNPKIDLSLKENLLAREPQEEEVAVDFRVEIERRFNKAIANQIFKFPRRKAGQTDSADETTLSSVNSSFESLKHVTIYDLSSQNKKRKVNQVKQVFRAMTTDDGQLQKSVSNCRQQDLATDVSSESAEYDAEEKSGIPLELRIRDKTSATYKKLLNMLDVQLNQSVTKPDQGNIQPPVQSQQPKRPQQTDQEQRARALLNQQMNQENTNMEYAGHLNTGEDQDMEVHKIEHYRKKKERNIKSQGRQERAPTHFIDSQRPTKLTSSSGIQGVKKNYSQDKVNTRIETVPTQLGTSALEKTFSRLSASTTKGDSKTSVDLNKITQESFKKLYNSSLLKSITPQYTKNPLSTNVKENVFKTYSQENYPGSGSVAKTTTMDALYQKAKNEILNHKSKTSMAGNPAQASTKNNSSISTTKREETPKDVARKVNFNNFYGSPDAALDKSYKVLGHASQNSLTKKESVRAFQMAAPPKKVNDAPIYASYDFSSQPKITKKPSFKLDFNKRGQGSRDTLSSARNRQKRTPDKFAEGLNSDSALRNSYDMNQYSYILNTSTQKNNNKKQIGFVPGTSTAKSLSFTKTFFSYK